VLNFPHRCTRFCLFKCFLGKCLMSILKFFNLFLLQVNFGHFPMVISELFIIIIIGWLFILLELVNWFFFPTFFGWLHSSWLLIILIIINNCLSLSLSNRGWILGFLCLYSYLSKWCSLRLLNRLKCCWNCSCCYVIVVHLSDILNLLRGEMQLL
jgi:hypothetical protein